MDFAEAGLVLGHASIHPPRTEGTSLDISQAHALVATRHLTLRTLATPYPTKKINC